MHGRARQAASATVNSMDAALARPLALVPRPPYRFDFALTYFTRRAGELVDRAEDGVYRRLFVVHGVPLLAELRPEAGGGLGLSVRAEDGAPPGEAAVEQIAATLRRTLGLVDELDGFCRAVAGDARLAALATRFAGLRLISTPAPFEAFVWAVLGQQISLHVAFRLKAALVRRCGVQATVAGVPYWAFPTPETLAAEPADELAALGLGRRKAATIVHAARLVADGDLDSSVCERRHSNRQSAIWWPCTVSARGRRATRCCAGCV